MPYYDKSSVECLVFAYKEGLLSAMGHDLELRVSRVEVDVDHERRGMRARADTRSLEVVGAMEEGVARPDLLGAADKHKIEEAIRGEVLDSKSYPEVRFVSSSVSPEGDGYRVAGELTLHGRTRPVNVVTRREADRQVADVQLDQRDFGIKPYAALLGALKVKPHVMVRISVPDPRA